MLRAQYIPVSRLHLSRYVIGSSIKRASRGSRGETCRLPPRPRLAARDTRDMQHKYTIKINRVRDYTLVAHALRQGLDARDPRASRVVEGLSLEPATHNVYTVAFFD